MRLDAYVAQYWPEHSRSTWQKFIANGYVYVNGEPETSAKRLLDEDDEVTVKLPDLTPAKEELPIVYEDEHVVVFNKPAGILTHSKGAVNEEFTLADYMRPLQAEKDETNRPGIIHRLDRDTSGIIIAAKDSETKRLLQKQFQDRKAKKTYLAIVVGRPKLDEARIDLPIERHPKKPATHRVGANGKSAVTTYKVLASNGKFSVVELRPETGRTHQLRVHLAYLGTPIVGDRLYGSDKSPIGRLCLHAKSLEITIPTSQRRTFDAAPPHDFQQLIDEVSA